MFPKPETPPAPVLKKPDDGAVVVFPKPGVAGILTPLITMGPTVTLAPRFSGMRSIVIGGVLKPSIWPDMSIVNGSGAAGMVKPGIVKPGVPIDALASSASGLLGMLMPFGKSVIAGVFQLTVTGNCWLILVSIVRLPNWRVTLPARSLISIPEMLTTPKPKKGPTGKVVLKFWAGNRVTGEMVRGPTLMGMAVPPPRAGITMSGTTNGPKVKVW